MSDISFQLRTWAEKIRERQPNRYRLLCDAADKLDDQEERIAIMTEHTITDPDLTFPPDDSELNENKLSEK